MRTNPGVTKLLISLALLLIGIKAMSVEDEWKFYENPPVVFDVSYTSAQQIHVVIDYSKSIPLSDNVTKLQLLEYRRTYTLSSDEFQLCKYQNVGGQKYFHWTQLQRPITKSSSISQNSVHSETFEFPISPTRKILMVCTGKLTSLVAQLYIVAVSRK